MTAGERRFSLRRLFLVLTVCISLRLSACLSLCLSVCLGPRPAPPGFSARRASGSAPRQSLPASSVALNEHARHNFTDLAFEAGYGDADTTKKRMYVGTATGEVFQVNLLERRLECIYKVRMQGALAAAQRSAARSRAEQI